MGMFMESQKKEEREKEGETRVVRMDIWAEREETNLRYGKMRGAKNILRE